MKSLLLSIIFVCVITITLNAQCWSLLDSTYTMGFETSQMDEFANWTIVDSDANDTTWFVSDLNPHTGDSSAAIKMYGNDWLFSPCMQVDSGTTYEFSFWYRRTYPYIYNQSLLFTIGSSASVIGITDTLITIDSINVGGYHQAKVLYTPNTNLTLNIGLYAYGSSEYDYTRIFIDDIMLKKYACDTLAVFAGNDTSVQFCKGHTLQLSATNGYETYLWNAADSLSITNQLTVIQAGTYVVEVSDSNACIGRDTVVIANDSIFNNSVIDAEEYVYFCQGDSVSLQPLDNFIVYQWKNAEDNLISTDSIVWVKENEAITLIALDTNGCYGTDEVFVSESEATLLITAEHATLCTGDSLRLTASTGFESYLWNGVDSLSVTNTLYITASDTFNLVATDAYGCAFTSTYVLADTSIITSPLDSIIAPSQTTICLNDSALIKALVIGGINSQYNFYWQTNNGNIDSVYADTAIVVKTSGNYYAIITDTTTGCSSYTASVSITVSEPYNQQDICIVTVDSVTGKNLIVWEKQDSLGIEAFRIYKENYKGNYDTIATLNYTETSIFTDTLSNPEIKAFSYKITVIDTCGNESALEDANTHTTIHLAINEGVGNRYNLNWTPYIGFSFDTYKIYRDTSVSQNASVLLDSVSYNVTSYTDIAPISGVDNYYYIEVIRDSACVLDAKKKGGNCIQASRSNVMSSQLASVSDLEQLQASVSIYPNPVKETALLSYSLPSQTFVSIDVYDMLGKYVTKIFEGLQNGKQQITLNAASLNLNGVYSIRIKTKEGEINKQIVLVK